MTTLIAAIDDSAAALPVLEVAQRIAALLGVDVEALHVPEDGSGSTATAVAAAVGVPDDVKGEALWVFVVVAAGVEADDALRAELTKLVTDRLGSSFRPSAIRFTTALPKTRSAKVLRRAIRAVVTGDAPGDLSGLEDPGTLDAVAHAT